MKEGWTYKKLGEVCRIERGGSPRPIKQFITEDMNGLNWIKIGDTDPQGKYIYQTKEKIKPEGLKKSRWVEVDEFLLSNSMSFGRPYILKTNGCIHDGWLVLRDYQQYLNIDFFYYMLISQNVQSQFRQRAQGSTVSNLNTDRVAGVSVSFPSLSEQHSIVARLDAAFANIDALKANAEKQLAEARKLFQAELTECMRPKEGTNLSKIGSIATRITKGASPKWQGINYVDSGGVLFITSENVREGYIELNPPKYVDTRFNLKQQRSILKKDDVLVNIVGASIGRAAIFDLDIEDANVNQAVALIRLDTNVLFPEYLCMFLNSSVAFEKYNSMKKDAARANLSLENIGDVELYVPSIDVQHQIVSYLDTLSAHVRQLEEVQRKTLAECDALKQAMLKEVFE